MDDNVLQLRQPQGRGVPQKQRDGGEVVIFDAARAPLGLEDVDPGWLDQENAVALGYLDDAQMAEAFKLILYVQAANWPAVQAALIAASRR